ncbi:hypothetical protein QN277_004639 [Acacia crassicarpa]|uniref:Strictosidine synthase conserved region domain-containing protein n=1 Tax=Acacia crassicarpa TaxID=499986 RepID=A0AAE1J326_9FABA|nr:hypothetical protein QN277_004639 [Acacia crassicarpa]
MVRNWINTEGRPLGLALGSNSDILVGDADNGLVRVTREGEVEIDGVKSKFTVGIDVAEDGTIYLTDASYKYSLNNVLLELPEGKPHGTLISSDHPPTTLHCWLLISTWPMELQSHQINNLWSSVKPPREDAENIT